MMMSAPFSKRKSAISVWCSVGCVANSVPQRHEYKHDVSAGLLGVGQVAAHEVIVDLRAAGEIVHGTDAGGVLKAGHGG